MITALLGRPRCIKRTGTAGPGVTPNVPVDCAAAIDTLPAASENEQQKDYGFQNLSPKASLLADFVAEPTSCNSAISLTSQ
jgi:hypothetical protein